MNNKINNILNKLEHSKFRSSFKLKEKDIIYMEEKGLDTIRKHAYDFIRKRLSPKEIANDGRQTPMKGHPVFIAEHATATCCRKCLCKWHKIEMDKALTEEEISYIVDVIMSWIVKNYSKKTKKR